MKCSPSPINSHVNVVERKSLWYVSSMKKRYNAFYFLCIYTTRACSPFTRLLSDVDMESSECGGCRTIPRRCLPRSPKIDPGFTSVSTTKTERRRQVVRVKHVCTHAVGLWVWKFHPSAPVTNAAFMIFTLLVAESLPPEPDPERTRMRTTGFTRDEAH